MIDHKARAEVRKAVEAFLSDRIGSFEFDDRLSNIRFATKDETVKYAAGILWCAYSDTEDHPVRLDKQGWDTIQRVLLLLDSGAEMRKRRTRIWDVSQLFAAISFVALGALYFAIQAESWFVPLLLGGIVTFAIAARRKSIQAPYAIVDPWRALPFPSLAMIWEALDRTPQFTKQRYRPELAGRRPPWFNHISLPRLLAWPFLPVGWCFVSPLVILYQCFPVCIARGEFLGLSHSATSTA